MIVNNLKPRLFGVRNLKIPSKNYPSESVPKLLAIFALPLWLRSRTKKSMAEKFFFKKLVHPNFFNVELSYMQK